MLPPACIATFVAPMPISSRTRRHDPRARRLLVVQNRQDDATRPPEPSDEALVTGLLAGEDKSREMLYRKHVRYIAGMCTRLLRSAESGEDVTQDAFVLAFSKIHTLRDPGHFRSWLATIAVREVRRHLAKERLWRFLGLGRGLDDAPLDELAKVDLSVEARSELAALDFALAQLPQRFRVAWMLRYVEDEPLELVAAAGDCSLATAKRRIATADAHVRQHVNLEVPS